MKKLSPQTIWPLAAMAILFLTAILFRPLLPIDETRYMTVAWEMRLHDGWLDPLTMNFEPYHHKPPILFWMINLFWSVFGISRWAGLLPVALASFFVVLLTVRLTKKILPDVLTDPLKITFLMLGSVPFLIYSTLIMFDLTLTAFVLASLLSLLSYAETRKFRHVLLMGLFLGLGVLTKGPVAYLYVIFPVLFGPLWVRGFTRPVSWYGDCFAGIFLSIFPVLFWLLPVLAQSDNHFALWLIWEQTAGRVTGNFTAAHARPFYFYLPLLPLMFAPWIFFPSFWKRIRTLDRRNWGIRFLGFWLVPVFLSFCFISGKQPHYLLPLLPGVIAVAFLCLDKVSLKSLQNTVLILIAVLVSGQAIASLTYFRNYDLQPIAHYVEEHPNHPWAFVRNYHGEVGFLARLKTPVADRQMDEIEGWFKENPNGWAIIRYKHDQDVAKYEKIFSQSYRGKKLGVFRLYPSPPI